MVVVKVKWFVEVVMMVVEVSFEAEVLCEVVVMVRWL